MLLTDFIQIIVLALIQGITEFLPISSSGHLILVPAITGWKDQGVLTDMVTNVGSLTAVIIYFWRDVVGMLRGCRDVVQRRMTAHAKLVFNVAVGTIPIVIVGLLMKATGLDDHIRSATLVAINAIVFGILLYAADAFGMMTRTIKDMTWVSALVIGVAQAFSLSPGTSRSGITMTAARALGFNRVVNTMHTTFDWSCPSFVFRKRIFPHSPAKDAAHAKNLSRARARCQHFIADTGGRRRCT